MKIALCKTHFFGPISGADEILVTYAISLRQAGYDVAVVLLYKPAENDRFSRRLQHAQVPIVNVIDHSIAFMILRGLRSLLSSFLLLFLLIPGSTVSMRRIWQLLIDLISRAHYKRCRAFLEASDYDLLHVFTPDTGSTIFIRAGKEVGIPVLYHEMGTPNYLPALDHYYRRLEAVLPLCTEVAALSPTLATQWLERFPFLTKVSVLPLITEDSEMLRVSAQLPTNGRHETIFGYAARIETGKGPFVLADALSKLRRAGKGVHVRLAGAGPAMKEVQALARQLDLNGSLEFVGSYEGTVGCSAFMRTLDVFVLPSFAEGTSKSVIEAMAHGLPIITTNVGGSPDLLTAGAGILIPPGDSTALADAMECLASDPILRKQMGQAARDRYLKLFAPEAVLSMLVSTYARLTGSNRLETSAANGRHPWGTTSHLKS